jgi:hypothetical protein
LIPNIIHFVFGLDPNFGGRPFMLFHYLAIKSANEVNKPDKIYFICAHEPEGEHFEKAKQYVEIVKIVPPDSIFGNKLYHYAHKADVIRLERILEFGGIYLDLDVICQKPLTPLLKNNKLVLGESYSHWQYEPKGVLRKLLFALKIHRPKESKKYQGLCNAVIIAPPNDMFIKRWYETYKYFRAKGHDEFWDEQSVIVPSKLAEIYRDEIVVVPETYFFSPSFDKWGLMSLFEDNQSFKDAYIFHLWESLSYSRYLNKLDEHTILTIETTYNNLAKKFLRSN